MAQSNTRMSPRQKMINLMYIVLTAMLALNVSSDVLDGFTQVHDGLARTNETVNERNETLYAQLQAFVEQNPAMGNEVFDKAIAVRAESQKIYMMIDSLKQAIILKADGVPTTVENLQNRDDLEAASVIMLNPSTRRGERLRGSIDAFRAYIQEIVVDSVRRHNIEQALNTAAFHRPGYSADQSWEESKFENQPAVAALTLLTKLQNDIRYAEGEALSTLTGQLIDVDLGSLHINEMSAFVVPQSRMVMRGGRYSADIMLAAVDTAARPEVFVGGKLIPGGHYEFSPTSAGSFNYSGFIRVPHADGTVEEMPFTSAYTVFEPTATVSATMMNVLYAGIDNPISISVPGVAPSDVSATMTGGTLTRQGDHWVARSSAIGTQAVISVSATVEGRSQTVGSTSFKVRKLPDPTAFIIIGNERFKGGRAISKQQIMSAKGVGAAIDDGLLDIDFRVTSFQIVFVDSQGDGMITNSDGANFSSQQRERLRGLVAGHSIFFISSIQAIGPDGVSRVLNPIEVRVR